MVKLVSPFNPQKAIFFLVFLDYVFLFLDNTKVAWELSLMASSADVAANFPSFRVLLQA
jgi:hypothetical protein